MAGWSARASPPDGRGPTKSGTGCPEDEDTEGVRPCPFAPSVNRHENVPVIGIRNVPVWRLPRYGRSACLSIGCSGLGLLGGLSRGASGQKRLVAVVGPFAPLAVRGRREFGRHRPFPRPEWILEHRGSHDKHRRGKNRWPWRPTPSGATLRAIPAIEKRHGNRRIDAASAAVITCGLGQCRRHGRHRRRSRDSGLWARVEPSAGRRLIASRLRLSPELIADILVPGQATVDQLPLAIWTCTPESPEAPK